MMNRVNDHAKLKAEIRMVKWLWAIGKLRCQCKGRLVPIYFHKRTIGVDLLP